MHSENVRRRDFLKAAATGVAGASAAAVLPRPSLAAPEVAARHPNLVFVFADQLRYFSCGYAGDSLAHTPNIDRLAASGISFEQCVSSTPVCSAFRASLLTGKYTTSHGMFINELRLSPEPKHHTGRARRFA